MTYLLTLVFTAYQHNSILRIPHSSLWARLVGNVWVLFWSKNMKEIWKHVYHAPDYEVSNKGRLRRATDAIEKINAHRGRLMSLKPDKYTGYVRCSMMSRDGKMLREQVHRLVGRAFLGNHRKGAQINHKDGDKTNNTVENIEWCSSQENVKHAWQSGLSTTNKGEKHGMSKLKKRDIKVIKDADARGVMLKTIAEVYNVTLSTISNIVRGTSWR